MADFLLPEKVRIVNDFTKYPTLFQNAAFGTVAAAAATQMNIRGFGITKIANVTNVTMTRGTTPSLNAYRITAGTTLTVAASIPAGAAVTFVFDVNSITRRLHLARNSYYQFGQNLKYTVVMEQNDTAQKVLYKLYKAINANTDADPTYVIKATVGSGGVLNDTAGTLDILDVTLPEVGDYFQQLYTEGPDGFTSSYITAYAPALITPFFRGKGWGRDIEFLEKLKEGNSQDPRFFDFNEIPFESGYYTEIAWTFAVNRKGRFSTDLSNSCSFVLYVLENSANETVIDNIAAFFLTDPATRLVSAETDGIRVAFNVDGAATPLTNAAGVNGAQNMVPTHAVLTVLKGSLTTAGSYVIAESVTKEDTMDAFMLARFQANA